MVGMPNVGYGGGKIDGSDSCASRLGGILLGRDEVVRYFGLGGISEQKLRTIITTDNIKGVRSMSSLQDDRTGSMRGDLDVCLKIYQ